MLRSPSAVAIVSCLRCFLACLSSAHLSCAYAGQASNRCSIVSSSAPHAGHLALSTLPMRFRYWFTGAWASLSCAIRLAASRLSSLWLIVPRNPFEGVLWSMRMVRRPLGDPFHSSAHLAFSASWYALLTAAGFVSRGFLRYAGKWLLAELCPSAASLASLSAASFPSIPSCPAAHLMVSLYFTLLLLLRTCFAIRRISVAMW